MQTLAHSLSQVLGDQTGFIEERYLGDSIQQFLILMEQVHEIKIPTLFYFVDANKAFDSVDRTFMKLDKMGIGNLFHLCIDLIYDK